MDINEKGKAAKAAMSDEKKQSIVGLALIGVITIGLCVSGAVGSPDDSIPSSSTANETSISSQTDASGDADVSSDDAASQKSSDSESSSDAEDADSDTSSEVTDAPSSQDESAEESSEEEKPAETEAVETEAPAGQPSESKTTTTTKAAETTTTTTTTKRAETTTTTKAAAKTTTTTKAAAVTTTAAKTTTTTAQKSSSSGGGLSVSCNAGNSWDADDGHYTQLDIYVKNGSSSERSGWTVKVTVPSGTTISQSWSGDYSVSGTTLTIRPVDYNTAVPANGEINLGCIVVTSGDFTPSVTIE